MKTDKKLKLTPAKPGTLAVQTIASANILDFSSEMMPDKKKLKRISAAPLLKFQDWPVGVIISGKVTGLIQNLAKDKKMVKSVVIQMYHAKTDRSFLLPMTGTIRAAMREYLDITGEDTDQERTTLKTGPDGILNKTIWVTRRETGHSKKYNKEMFNFDVDVEQ